jgi:hypothetical protein
LAETMDQRPICFKNVKVIGVRFGLWVGDISPGALTGARRDRLFEQEIAKATKENRFENPR